MRTAPLMVLVKTPVISLGKEAALTVPEIPLDKCIVLTM